MNQFEQMQFSVDPKKELPENFECLKISLQKELEDKNIISDIDLTKLVETQENKPTKIFYHATPFNEWQKTEPNYFDRDKIVLAGGHFSFKADNLSYGSYDPSQLIEFRVIDSYEELKDTSTTGEGQQVGHEAIAMRPVVFKKLDDRFYKSSEIAIQSELDKNYYGISENEEEDKTRVRQITYIIDKEATEKGDLSELLKDPVFALKYLNEEVKQSLRYPQEFMDEVSATKFVELMEINEANLNNPKIVENLEQVRLEFGEWFNKLLTKDTQAIKVLAKENLSWQQKTDQVIKQLSSHKKFVDFYLNKYLPHRLSEGGMYEIKDSDLEQVQKQTVSILSQCNS